MQTPSLPATVPTPETRTLPTLAAPVAGSPTAPPSRVSIEGAVVADRVYRAAIFGFALCVPSMLAAGLILSSMVLPYVAAVSREVLMAVPRSQREAALALGATRWETITGAVIPFARSGIIGGMILGLGRALGETMAVTMV